jgi:glycosyltransferase involved in cell wall biosynthesis
MSNSRPLRILIALQYYVPHRTGLTLHVQRLAEAFVARGHEVTVVTARYNSDLPRDEEINGVRVIRLWAPIRVSRGMVMPAYLWAAYRLVKAHDVVSIHTPMLETALFAGLCRLLNKPLVITHHGDLILPTGALNRIIQGIVFQLYKIAARTAHRIVAYSHDYADQSYYITPFRDKTSVIYPPIEIPAPNPIQAEELRATWTANGHEQTPVIGYAGRFVEEKRPDLLIQALPIVHKSYPRAKIVFAGEYLIKYEGFYDRNLSLVEQHRPYLIFLGLLESAQEMADFYAACDVLVLPSDTECLGLVQAEAMLCGTPVVVTDTPGARETVRVTGMGLVVPPRDSTALAEGILRVLENRADFVKPHADIVAAYNFTETVARNERLFREAAT